MKAKNTSLPSDNQTPESPAEMAVRVHQVISALADGVLKLAHERFGEAGSKNDQIVDTKKPQE